jgi:hypothetical protein
MIDVIVFLGEAHAAPGNSLGYPEGQRHAIVAFLRQNRESPPDFDLAQRELSARGWREVSFGQAAFFDKERLNSVHPHAGASFEEALVRGFAAIAFSEPIR